VNETLPNLSVKTHQAPSSRNELQDKFFSAKVKRFAGFSA